MHPEMVEKMSAAMKDSHTKNPIIPFVKQESVSSVCRRSF